MTNEERTDIKVGLTVLASIAILLIGIGWAKGWHVAGHEIRYRAVFSNVGGLQQGDPVTINGVKRGTVHQIDLRTTDVVVTMEFPERVDLRSDAMASISMLELMSGKKIELRAGSSSQPLASNAMIPGVFAGDIGSLIEMVTSLSTSIESITGRADTLFASLSGMMQGDTLKTKLNGTLDNANRTLSHFDIAANHASQFFTDNGPMLTRTINEADSALRTLSAIAQENRVGLRVFIDSGAQAIADARRSLSRLDSMLVSGNQSNSMLYRLTKDPAFALRIDSALESLTKLSEQIRLQGIDANIRFFNSSKSAK